MWTNAPHHLLGLGLAALHLGHGTIRLLIVDHANGGTQSIFFQVKQDMLDLCGRFPCYSQEAFGYL